VRVITWGDEANPSFQEHDIQVTDFEGHNQDLLKVIHNKVKKQAPQGVEIRDLLVNIRDHPGEKIYPAFIAAEVKKSNPSFKNIWILMDDAENQ
jgi:hypothetical protein